VKRFDRFETKVFSSDTREPFPLRLRVLVLDYPVLERHHKVGTNVEDDQFLEKGEDNNLGSPEENKARIISRYPPITAILCNCNRASDSKVSTLEQYVPGTYGITEGIGSKTFAVQTKEIHPGIQAKSRRPRATPARLGKHGCFCACCVSCVLSLAFRANLGRRFASASLPKK